MSYDHYKSLTLKRHPDGILEVIMGAPGKLSTADHNMHRELAEIWRDIDADPETRVAIIRGDGKGFSAGGDLSLVEDMAQGLRRPRPRLARGARPRLQRHQLLQADRLRDARPAVGAGLVAGLLADVSIAAKNARIIDGHTRLGVAAGDHAAIVWPLLCGMAKAKYYLLLCEPVSGEEAERIGLVSLCVEEAELQAKALEVARSSPLGAQSAHPLDQVQPQQLAAHGGAELRCVARARIPRLHRARTCTRASSRCAKSARRTSSPTARSRKCLNKAGYIPL